ncbi:39738_t:CDS:1, partial [Gigaspora margarita]
PAILKQRIMSIQDKRERMLLLYDEFVEDNIVNTRNCIVKQYTKTLWQLVDKLTFAFYNPDPVQHDLFKYAQEMKPDSYIRMFNFYRSGLTRLYNILHKDIYKTKEPVIKGRWVKDLVNISAKQYLLAKKDSF